MVIYAVKYYDGIFSLIILNLTEVLRVYKISVIVYSALSAVFINIFRRIKFRLSIKWLSVV